MSARAARWTPGAWSPFTSNSIACAHEQIVDEHQMKALTEDVRVLASVDRCPVSGLFIAIALRTSAGNPAKLTAPPEAGIYDVRHVQDHGVYF